MTRRSSAVLAAFVVASATLGAQQTAAPAPSAATLKSFASSSDVAALVAKAKAERRPDQALIAQPLLQLAPYNVNIEHRMPGEQMATIHDHEAELFYVIDGAATIVTGGELVEPARTNPYNWAGKSIKDGTPRPIAKGDFIMVPEGVPHWFTEIKGSLTQIALHLPRADGQTWSGRIYGR